MQFRKLIFEPIKTFPNLKIPVALFPGCILLIFESAIQCWKKKKNTKENLGEESYRDIIDPNPSNNPELRTLAKNESSAIKTYLERLPLKVRQVVIMRYINEMNLEDISEAMHCSLSSVKRYLVKARKIMRDYLKERKL